MYFLITKFLSEQYLGNKNPLGKVPEEPGENEPYLWTSHSSEMEYRRKLLAEDVPHLSLNLGLVFNLEVDS